MLTRIAVLITICALLLPVSVTAQGGILADAERLAAGFELQPVGGSGGGRPLGKLITTLAMVGAGVGLAAMAKPDYVPSQFAPGNTPMRVDLSAYLGAGNYPGHSYRLVHRRGDSYGLRTICVNRATGRRTSGSCLVNNRTLDGNYDKGYTDGFDDGAYGGAVVGHKDGWLAGQDRVIEILDANGLTVYSGEFTPASYVKETFSDKAGLRMAGVGLAAVGAIIALFWPDSPARNLDLGYMPGGGRVGASFGF